MSQTPAGPNRTTATILHLALMLGPLVLVGVAVVLRAAPDSPFRLRSGMPLATLRLVGGVVAAGCYTAALLLRGRLDPPAGGESEDHWWAANQPRAVVLWALIEGAMLLGGVLFLLSGDLPILLGVTGTGLLLMLAFTPQRLAGG